MHLRGGCRLQSFAPPNSGPEPDQPSTQAQTVHAVLVHQEVQADMRGHLASQLHEVVKVLFQACRPLEFVGGTLLTLC